MESVTYNQITEQPTQVIEKRFHPTKKQQDVVQIPDSVFEALGGGAAGGGKTDIGIMLPLLRGFHNHPKFKGLVMRRTVPDLEKEIVPRQHEWYAPSGAKYNDTKKVWKWPWGARIQNGHAEREQDVRKYDSAEYNYIDWDESTHFTSFQYLYLTISRCRSSSPDLPAFTRSFTNPGNVGHGFFKNRFVDANPRGGTILRDKITGTKRIYIPFLGKDNPYLTLNDPTYLQRLEGLPEIERKAKLYGDWNSYEGQVFTEYRVLHLEGEPENAVHVIQPFKIPSWWPKFLCIDWGYDAMTFAIWCAVSPSGRLYIYRTFVWLNTLIKIWVRDAVNLSGDEIYEDIVICHSAGARKGEEKTIQQQVQEAFDDHFLGPVEDRKEQVAVLVRLADKDRVGGKNMIHEYLRWKQKPTLRTPDMQYDNELAQQILRKYGESKYREYLSFFIPEEPETNLPKMQIFSHSLMCDGSIGHENKELIDVIPACIPDEHNREDVAEFPGDDPYDTLRMAVKAAHRYVDESKSEQDKRNRIQKVLDEFHNSQNQTAFYLNMQKLEAEDASSDFAVRATRRLGNRRFVH